MNKSIFIILFHLLLLMGELLCIFKFVTSDFKTPYKREIIYGVSTVTLLGCYVGYIDIKDKWINLNNKFKFKFKFTIGKLNTYN